MNTFPYGKQSVSQYDIDAVLGVLRPNFLTQGPKVREFEDVICEYTGSEYCVAVSSATAALHLSMIALGISVSK
ncbi:MAG: DegT/DnrJ/EryC1/StrS family aminotransferase [Holosporaceae bacterium]|jgi:dTDP-4-amino-4,6-dideoxygalactose transaminase|nr:DegT/DnrJ/EryC1/StrS family aminotransferase [Holosporaceae bacterium]